MCLRIWDSYIPAMQSASIKAIVQSPKGDFEICKTPASRTAITAPITVYKEMTSWWLPLAGSKRLRAPLIQNECHCWSPIYLRCNWLLPVMWNCLKVVQNGDGWKNKPVLFDAEGWFVFQFISVLKVPLCYCTLHTGWKVIEIFFLFLRFRLDFLYKVILDYLDPNSERWKIRKKGTCKTGRWSCKVNKQHKGRGTRR